MLSIVTSYLLLAKHCVLPGIGEFVISTKPAQSDLPHHQIHPPVDEIVFTENETAIANPGLVKYIASKWNEDEDTAESIFNNYCEDWKREIAKGEVVVLHTLGSLQKNAVGNIFFRKNTPELIYRDPIHAQRVIHEDADHPMLVGDIETSTNRMTDYYTDAPPVKRRNLWGVWAALLATAAIIILFFHFNNSKFSIKSTGNKTGIVVDTFLVEKISSGVK